MNTKSSFIRAVGLGVASVWLLRFLEIIMITSYLLVVPRDMPKADTVRK